MKIDFTAIEVPVSFDGTTQRFNIAEVIGNAMMFNGNIILDIGFEELAKEIYYSKGEVEVPEKYAQFIVQIVMGSNLPACIKRFVRDKLSKKG